MIHCCIIDSGPAISIEQPSHQDDLVPIVTASQCQRAQKALQFMRVVIIFNFTNRLVLTIKQPAAL